MTPSELAEAAKCYCFDDATWKKVAVYLLSVTGGGGGPCPQDMQVAWTPTNLKLGENLGFFTFGDIPGITSITFNQSMDLAGFDIENTTTITSLSWPNLTSIDPSSVQSGYLDLETNSGLTAISLPLLATVAGLLGIDGSDALATISIPSLTACGRLNINSNSALTSFSAPSLQTVGGILTVNSNAIITSVNLASLTTCSGAFFQIHLNPALTSLTLGAFVPPNGQNIQMDGNALPAATVNFVLHQAVLNAGYVSGTIDLFGGTNAAPSGQGIADKATLIGRGVTVNTN